MLVRRLTHLLNETKCKSLVVLIVILIISSTVLAESNYQCKDFEGMVPVWELSSSVTEASSGGETDYLSLETDGAVVVFRSSERNRVEARRIVDGIPLWLFETDGEVNSLPLIADGMVFFGSDDGYFYALDERTGHLIWKFDGRRSGSDLEKITEKGKSLFGGLSLENLKGVAQEMTKKELQPNDLRARPAIAKGVLAIYVPREKIIGLSYETGQKLWETKILGGKEPWWASWYPGRIYNLPIHKILSDGERFYVGVGAVISLDPRTGHYTLLWPVGNEHELNRHTNWPVCNMKIIDDRIVAAVYDSGVIAVGKEGEGLIWHLDPSQLPGTYSRIYIEGEDGFVLVEGKGIVCFDPQNGNIKWITKQQGAEKIWIGPNQAYLIYQGNHIKALERRTGNIVWDKNFSNTHVNKLYDCRGTLAFGCDETQCRIIILCTEPRVWWAMHTTYGFALAEGQPAQVVRKVLKSYYPELASSTFFTEQAKKKLISMRLSNEQYPLYDGWYLQRQEITEDSAKVEVAVRKVAGWSNGLEVPLMEPKWEICTFHLSRENGEWLICSPLPDSCEIDTLQLSPLLLDTPGIEPHPSGDTRSRWPLTLMPGDHWKFKSWVGGDVGESVSMEGEGHFVVKSYRISENNEYIWKLKQTSWVDTIKFGEESKEMGRMERIIEIGMTADSMWILIPGHKKISTIKIPLPLKDTYTYSSPDSVEVKVRVSEDPDSGIVSAISFRDEGREFSTEFIFSNRKGIVGWKQDLGIGAPRWDWTLVESHTW